MPKRAKAKKIRIEWHGEKLKREMRREMGNRLLLAAELVRGEAVKAVSEPFSTGSATTRYKPKRTGTPSKEGEPPKADLGKLRQSIFSDVDRSRLIGIVGTTLKVGAWLETGTRRMKARPYLVPTLVKMRAAIKRILTKPMK